MHNRQINQELFYRPLIEQFLQEWSGEELVLIGMPEFEEALPHRTQVIRKTFLYVQSANPSGAIRFYIGMIYLMADGDLDPLSFRITRSISCCCATVSLPHLAVRYNPGTMNKPQRIEIPLTD
jgi:hypothetical protein